MKLAFLYKCFSLLWIQFISHIHSSSAIGVCVFKFTIYILIFLFLFLFSVWQRWATSTGSVSTVTWSGSRCPNTLWCSCLEGGRGRKSRRWLRISQAPPSTASKNLGPKTSTTSSRRRPRCTSPTSRKIPVIIACLRHETGDLTNPNPPPHSLTSVWTGSAPIFPAATDKITFLCLSFFCQLLGQRGSAEGFVLLQWIHSQGLQVFPVSETCNELRYRSHDGFIRGL